MNQKLVNNIKNVVGEFKVLNKTTIDNYETYLIRSKQQYQDRNIHIVFDINEEDNYLFKSDSDNNTDPLFELSICSKEVLAQLIEKDKEAIQDKKDLLELYNESENIYNEVF